MAPLAKRIRKCVTKAQIEIIVNEMEKNKALNKGLLNPNYTAQQKLKDWEKLVSTLNAAGGAVKELEKWQKCWTDYKSETKKKYNFNKGERSKTGGGKAELKELTPLEERILALIGLDAIEGLSVPESCSFSDQSASQEYLCMDMPHSSRDMPHASQETMSEYVVPNATEFDERSDFDVTNIEVEVHPGSTVEIPITPSVRATPSAGRLNSLKKGTMKRTRNRGMVLGTENSAKLIEAQNATANGLMAVAAALEKNNDQQGKIIEIQTQQLELEKRKTAAFENLVTHFMENYP